MNIVIEARALSAKSGGVKTYTHELIRTILSLHKDTAVELLYSSESPIGTFPAATETTIPLASEAVLPYWLSVQVARHIKKTKPSLVHYTKAAIPYVRHAPTVVTIYDIIPVLLPETQSPFRRIYWPHVLRYAAKHADHIMTISKQSKQDIVEHFGVPENRITVTPLAIDTNHFKPTHNEKDSPYILFVGTRDARKNIPTLIRAFASIADTIPHRLVIAGREAHKKDGSEEAVRTLHMEHRVEFKNYVPYKDLPLLYSGADLFVWPSVYEGWGFPPQEAMACGTPVIVSNGGPLPEVVGDAGSIVPFTTKNLTKRMHDIQFTNALAEKMREVLQNEELRKSMRQRGIDRTTHFSWTTIAQATWNVYQNIAS